MKKDKLHILQVVGQMNRGGAEVMLMDIFRCLSNNIHFDFLVNYKVKKIIDIGDFDQEILAHGSKIKYIGTQWDIGIKKYIKEFNKICQEIGVPDVVHIHLNAKSGVIAMAAKKAGIKKIITHSHADLKFRGSFFYNMASEIELYIQKILIKKYATDFWGASKEACKSLYGKRDDVAIINNAINVKNFQSVTKEQIDDFRKEFEIDKKTLILGNIGRIVRHKNIGFIIDILDKLNLQKNNFLFIFAGRADDEVYMKEIKEKIRKYNLSKKVLYLGIRDDIPLILSVLDIFIAPALKEGFGLVAVEAQSLGIPSLLYKGFPKLVDMELNLVSFMDNFNQDLWLEKIIEIRYDKIDDYKLISQRIKEKGFDIKENIKKIEKLYRC